MSRQLVGTYIVDDVRASRILRHLKVDHAFKHVAIVGRMPLMSDEPDTHPMETRGPILFVSQYVYNRVLSIRRTRPLPARKLRKCQMRAHYAYCKRERRRFGL